MKRTHLPAELEAAWEEIEAHAKSYGLDFFPIIYEVLDYHSEKSFPSLMETVCHFSDGLTQYRRGNWDQAITSFKDTLKLHPEDQLSNTYIERCSYMKTHPPGDDWNGVFVMTSK